MDQLAISFDTGIVVNVNNTSVVNGNVNTSVNGIVNNTGYNSRQKARVSFNQMQTLLQKLGYVECGNLWISPKGREATLLSMLSYRILSTPGLRLSLRSLTAVRLCDAPFDLLDNMMSMIS